MKEDQKTITAWAVKTFGDPESCDIVINRLIEEFDEFLATPEVDPGECADLLIILYQICEHAGFDLLEAVDEKMAVNRARKWATLGDGTGQHIPEDN